MKPLLMTVLATCLILPYAGPAPAAGNEHGQGHAHGAAAPNEAEVVEGEIKRVNKSAGALTIQHGPIRSMDMPGMTMEFKVRDKGMLENVKRGDKVRFTLGAGDDMVIESLSRQ